ncbi:probable protein phosphatase 2C 49 [Phragmites australis]|uniref:probable protein phosphatase 2C 49 n=1 Tax=Phragmites australis TaxID=29695 RepID=UPI002D78595A|nr:probable protein phosphatase 2C 49 [Phragmites australis]
MAEICSEEAKSAPESAPTAALARRRSRVEMAEAGAFRSTAAADQGGARGGKRRRLACAAPGRPRPGAGFASRWWPRYGVTSVCGLRREMEDAVSIRPDFLPGSSSSSGKHHFFGVFDGHGCSHVARMCQDRMHELVADEYKKAGSGKGAAAWKEVMEKGFARMDGEASSWAASRNGDDPACRCELQTPARCDHVGSTAVVAVVGPTRVVVANAGDSRAVLSRGGVPVPLSVDHKPDRPDELERVQAAGARVIYWDGARVLGVLAMSRAIGDGYLKPFVTSEPEVTVTERTDDDECLILASDGLWDVVTNEMACEVVRACFRSNGPPSSGARPNGVLPSPAAGRGGGAAVVIKGVDKADSDRACSDAALLLAKLALARRSSDNVSVVVVDLRLGS